MADVQKSAFSLSSATLMLGKAFTDDVFALTPTANSVGMISEANVTLDSSVTELMNGVAQAVVDSKRTNIKANITGNVFEMTAQNFMRAQAMAGPATQVKRGVLATALVGSDVSISITSDPVPGDVNSAISAITDIPAGATILIQRTGATGQADYVFPTKTSGAATSNSGTFTLPLAAPYTIPSAMNFPVGSHVWVIQPIGVGNIDSDDLFCAKLTGTLTAYDRPLTLVVPKVRIVKGFALSFNEKQYTSMPWQLEPLLMSASEVATNPRFADIGTRQPALLYPGA